MMAAGGEQMPHDFENVPDASGNLSEQPNEFLKRATQAYAAGDAVLAMHLYLAAFEQAYATGMPSAHDAVVDGLREAWELACKLKERSIAEYVFSKLEPYLSQDEIKECGERLQNLALGKLEEIGIHAGDIEEITNAIAQEVFGLESASDFNIRSIKPFDLTLPPMKEFDVQPKAQSDSKEVDASSACAACGPDNAQKDDEIADAVSDFLASGERLTYKNLVGYDDAIRVMRSLGVGMGEDPEHIKLVEMLNARHGLSAAPAPDSLLMRSPAREDASRFMEATLGELGVPGIRMHVEESWQGAVMLCLSAQKSKDFTFDGRLGRFEGRGALLLEDIDLWEFPQPQEPEDGLSAFMLAQMSRGAREAVNLIRTAVEDPNVYVLATASSEGPIEPFLLEILGPLTEVDIAYPTAGERAALWIDLAKKHPSIRGVNRVSLVRFSANLARFDICMAARDAIEDAYKQGLRAGRYTPVHPYDLFEKLAAYQPLDSKEYAELEEAMIRDFSRGLNSDDPLFEGR